MRFLPKSLARRVAAAALCAGAAGAGGCNDFLTGDKLTVNPNAPTEAAPLQVLLASQIGLFVQQEGQLARLAAIYMQQLSGTNNQQADYGSRYSITEQDVVTFWNQTYTGTGWWVCGPSRAARAPRTTSACSASPW
jgi:hypothetical protein